MLVLGVLAILGALSQISITREVVNVEPEVVETTVEVDALEKAIQEAQESKKDAIEEIAQQAWQAAYDQEMKEVELEVRKQFSEENDATIIELEKEIGLY